MSAGVEYANPHIVCDRCGRQASARDDNCNQPCGHHAGFHSTCPSWGPVDGCTCEVPHHPRVTGSERFTAICSCGWHGLPSGFAVGALIQHKRHVGATA